MSYCLNCTKHESEFCFILLCQCEILRRLEFITIIFLLSEKQMYISVFCIFVSDILFGFLVILGIMIKLHKIPKILRKNNI